MEMMSEHSHIKNRRRLLNSRAIAERYNIVAQTVDRWVKSGVLPQPFRINSVRYWDADEIEARDRTRFEAQQ
jgi:predicted DNA-binding transcriptional regulator AlpA